MHKFSEAEKLRRISLCKNSSHFWICCSEPEHCNLLFFFVFRLLAFSQHRHYLLCVFSEACMQEDTLFSVITARERERELCPLIYESSLHNVKAFFWLKSQQNLVAHFLLHCFLPLTCFRLRQRCIKCVGSAHWLKWGYYLFINWNEFLWWRQSCSAALNDFTDQLFILFLYCLTSRSVQVQVCVAKNDQNLLMLFEVLHTFLSKRIEESL